MLQTAESDVRQLFHSWAHTHERPYKPLNLRGYTPMRIWEDVKRGDDLNGSLKNFLYSSSNRFEDPEKLLESEIRRNSTRLPKTVLGWAVRKFGDFTDRVRYNDRIQDILYPILG